nr:O-antigen ligase family protein [Polynucleobacter sp. Nonnen-W13]
MSAVFFCLPSLALACGQCIRLVNQKTPPPFLLSLLYVGTIVAVLTVFYLENTKNGFVYSIILIAVTLVKITLIRKARWSWRDSAIIFLAVAGLTFVGMAHLKQNDSWKTLAADLRVAGQLEEIDSWKYYGSRGYPINDLGREVSPTNYERATWAQVVTGMIGELPLGYGLIYKSFGYYGKDKWPDSILFQAHSAWLDLTLGIGIPGVLLLFLAGVVALNNALHATYRFWGNAALWIISSIALLMTTTEVSQSIYIDTLVFMILWVAGLGLNCPLRCKASSAPACSKPFS